MKYSNIVLALTVLVFTACGGGSSSPKSNDTKMTCSQNSNKVLKSSLSSAPTIEQSFLNQTKLLVQQSKIEKQAKEFDNKGLYDLFHTEYFWAEETKTLDYNSYNTPQTLIDALKYKEDKWSFAITPEEYNEVSSQKAIGLGFSCQDFKSGCLITYIRMDSPADKIDLRRGDIIEKVNNQKATQESIYKFAKEEKNIEFKISRLNSNEQCTGTVTPKEYTYTVAKGDILETRNKEKVGYLRLDSFLGDKTIVSQLDKSFDNFKKENIQKLIIDLRYNGGGSVDVASTLLNKLLINKKDLEQFTLAWNKNYRKKDKAYLFDSASNSLDLKQILFLTTQNSASASELIISAMKPYLPENDVVIIGDKTHGKPVGMEGKSDGNYYYFLINFVVKNSLGFYEYFEGLPVTEGCEIKDDPFHEMGDKEEAMLKSALLYVDIGSCE